jgi:hypothetical protein
MSTQKVYPVYSFQYIQNKLVELSRQKLNYADLPEQVQADWTETDITSYAYIKNKPTLPAIVGDVVGPASSVDGDVVLFDGTTGKLIKDSGVAFTDVMQKSVYDTDNSGVVDKAEGITILGRNSTGATLYKGSIVYISGSTGNRPNFTLSRANAESTSAGTFGMILADMPNNTDGYVMCAGFVDNLDTRTTAPHPITAVTLADGDKLYLDPNNAGYVTNVKPSAPNHLVYIGVVTRTSPTNGTIVLRIQNGYELDELHDVAIATPTNNDILTYESSTTLWKNKTIATILGYTPQAQITLTTTGSSGSATFVSNTLNIPTYTADGLLPSQTGNSGKYLTTNGTTTSWATVSSGGMTNPMTTAGDIIYGGASGTPTRLGIGTNGFILQVQSGNPAWFNLFGTANTFTTTQTILWNNGVSRSLILNAMTGSASATSFSGAAGTAVSFASGNFGIMMTHNSSFNAPWIYPIFTLANRSLFGYTATVPQIQLRISTLSGTHEKNIEWAMPTNSTFTAYDVAIRYDLFNTSSSYRFVQHYMRTSIDTAGALNPASALLHIGANTTGYAQINLKTSVGTNPSAPADGDIWYDGTNLKMRVGATTKTFTLV